MNVINKMHLKIPALSINESFARGVVAAFCVFANPSLEEINDLKTAISEAVTNCVVHGYGGKDGVIEICAKLYKDHVWIKIEDFGIGIEDTNKALQPFFSTKPDKERSGMGFTVMQAFMDEVVLISQPKKGTTVEMTKFFNNEVGVDA